jgi:hypothetical protein
MPRLVGKHVTLDDGSVWSTPCDQADDSLEWRLRYAETSITRTDQLLAAGIISCYREMLIMPERRRRYVVAQLRAAMNAPKATGEPK